LKHDTQDLRVKSRRAVVSLHDAERQLLIASQRAARRAAVQSIHAALSVRHGSAVSAVLAKFADRRAALAQMGGQGRGAALQQLSADETYELARLALEHAAEKRALRKLTLLPLARQQRAARRHLRLRNRRQRIVSAVQLEPRRLHRPTSMPYVRRVHIPKSKSSAVDRPRR
jgi:hypothetical protein